MRITVYLTDGTTKNDAMIDNITERDDSYCTVDIWGNTIIYKKAKVALITVQIERR